MVARLRPLHDWLHDLHLIASLHGELEEGLHFSLVNVFFVLQELTKAFMRRGTLFDQ